MNQIEEQKPSKEFLIEQLILTAKSKNIGKIGNYLLLEDVRIDEAINKINLQIDYLKSKSNGFSSEIHSEYDAKTFLGSFKSIETDLKKIKGLEEGNENLKTQNQGLETNLKSANDKILKLKKQIKELSKENSESLNQDLKTKNQELETENQGLKKELKIANGKIQNIEKIIINNSDVNKKVTEEVKGKQM